MIEESTLFFPEHRFCGAENVGEVLRTRAQGPQPDLNLC